MILFILLGMIIGAIKRYRVTVLFREISLLPMMIEEIVFWYFQVCAWRGDYRFVPYGVYLQMCSILVLIWPIIKFKLYPQALIGSVSVAIGSVMNKVVMKANGGAMPVHPIFSRTTLYYRDGALEAANDTRHLPMSLETKLNFLADYIDVGFSIMSIGDLFIHGFTTLVIYNVIAKLNLQEKG